MVLLFAVFVLAILVALIAAEGLAERVALLTAFASWASDTCRILVGHGVDVAERMVTKLAADPRNSVGIEQILPYPRIPRASVPTNPGNWGYEPHPPTARTLTFRVPIHASSPPTDV